MLTSSGGSRPLVALAVSVALSAGCQGPLSSLLSSVGEGSTAGLNNASPLNGANPLTGNTPLAGVIVDEGGRPVAGVTVKTMLAGNTPLVSIAPFSDSALVGNSGAGLVNNSGGGLANNSGGAYRIALAAFLAPGGPVRKVQAAATTDQNGVFRIDGPEEGTINLEAVKNDDFKAFKKAIQVKKDVPVDLGKIPLEPTGTITGVVTAPDEPLVQDFEGADVFIPGTDYVAKASRNGTFTIRNVAVGTFDLAARHGSVGKARVEDVTVRPKETTRAADLALAISRPTVLRAYPPHAGPKATVILVGDSFGAVSGEPISVMFGGLRLESVERLGAGGLKVRLPDNPANGNFQLVVQGVAGPTFSFRILKRITIERFDEALRLGDWRQYAASATDSDGAPVSNPVVLWEQEGDTLTVSATGDVRGRALGMSSLYAFSGTVGDERHINVVDRYSRVATLAGSGTRGSADGLPDVASFDGPRGLAIDAQGNVLVCDTGTNQLRKVSPAGSVTTLAGGDAGDVEGAAGSARFNGPRRLAIAADGTVFVADSGNRKLKKISGGLVSTVASGRDFAAVAAGAPDTVFAIDKGRNEVLRFDAASPEGTVVLSAPSLEVPNPLGGAPTVSTPTGLAVGPGGALYLADPNASRVWKVEGSTARLLAGSFDVVRLVSFGLVDGKGDSAQFSGPTDLAVDAQGNVYVADTQNHRVRKIRPDGLVTTLAGSGRPERGNGGFLDGDGVSARFDEPGGIAIAADGTLYLSDTGNNRIRTIAP